MFIPCVASRLASVHEVQGSGCAGRRTVLPRVEAPTNNPEHDGRFRRSTLLTAPSGRTKWGGKPQRRPAQTAFTDIADTTALVLVGNLGFVMNQRDVLSMNRGRRYLAPEFDRTDSFPTASEARHMRLRSPNRRGSIQPHLAPDSWPTGPAGLTTNRYHDWKSRCPRFQGSCLAHRLPSS